MTHEIRTLCYHSQLFIVVFVSWLRSRLFFCRNLRRPDCTLSHPHVCLRWPIRDAVDSDRSSHLMAWRKTDGLIRLTTDVVITSCELWPFSRTWPAGQNHGEWKVNFPNHLAMLCVLAVGCHPPSTYYQHLPQGKSQATVWCDSKPTRQYQCRMLIHLFVMHGGLQTPLLYMKRKNFLHAPGPLRAHICLF